MSIYKVLFQDFVFEAPINIEPGGIKFLREVYIGNYGMDEVLWSGDHKLPTFLQTCRLCRFEGMSIFFSAAHFHFGPYSGVAGSLSVSEDPICR
jgi:hypothetical protein